MLDEYWTNIGQILGVDVDPIQHYDYNAGMFSLFLSLQKIYLSTFRQVYTVGYATSLISLITAIVVFTAFR